MKANIKEDNMEFNETDLAAVGKIQEAKGITVAEARTIYRKQVLKLANQDVENRAELVLQAIERGAEVASDEEVEDTVTKPKAAKKTRRLERNEKRNQKKVAKPKVAKKKANGKKPSKSATPRLEFPLPKLEREVELTPADDLGIYTANLFGRKHAVAFMSADRQEQGDSAPLHFSERRIADAKKLAKANDQPLAFCVSISVKGKLEQGYAVPAELFGKFSSKLSRERVSMSLSAEARKAYSEDGWDGVKFSEKKVEERAA
jgi:hypothetical protein